MKKIGVLTHCVATNYGANLQSLSTAYYLRNHGYEPVFLNWSVYLDEVNIKMNPKQVEMHSTILSRHGFKVSCPCNNPDDFLKVIENEDIHNIIVGSDAVLTIKPFIDSIRLTKKGIKWGHIQPDYLFPNPFWLDFLQNTNIEIKAFLMSPSCQSSRYKLLSKEIKRQMSEQLEIYSYLSARDEYTQKMICDIANIDTSKVPLTPDPVWNFNENLGNKIPSKKDLLSKYKITNDNYVLLSFYSFNVPSDKWLNDIANELKKKGYETYFIPMPQDDYDYAIKTIRLPIDSVDYFSLIKYSKGYIGNNMHPIITAIHNGIPFVSIDHHGKWYLHGLFQSSKSSKVKNLLDRFSLSENRIALSNLKKKNITDIVDTLLNTNLDLTKEMSNELRKEYLVMMNNITQNFL